MNAIRFAAVALAVSAGFLLLTYALVMLWRGEPLLDVLVVDGASCGFMAYAADLYRRAR